MKKYIIVLSLFLGFGLSLNAQNQGQEVAVDPKAKVVLDNASSNFANKAGFVIDMSVTIDNNQSGKKSTIKGNLLTKKEKFKLTFPDVVTYYDGKTEYVHLLKENEVNVSNPKAEDLKDTNPIFLLQSYKKDYKMRYEGTKTIKGKTLDVVSLFPNDRNKPFSIVTITIDKNTLMPVSIQTKGKNGIDTTVDIISCKEKNIEDVVFVFDEKANKNVELIDLR